jgi:GTPase KRas protein
VAALLRFPHRRADILDTAGQEEYRVLQDQYIHRGEGFLIIYSISSRASFELVTKFQQKIFMVKDEDKYYPMARPVTVLQL